MRPFLAKRSTKQRVVMVVGSISLLTVLGYVLVAMGFITLGTRTSVNQIPPVPTAQTNPTDTALEKSRLENEKLSAEIIKLQREIQPNVWTLLLANIPVIVGAVIGVIGIGRWIADRRDAREKRLDDRFQSAVEGLGSEHVVARVQAAAVLINFLQPGYERFYKEIFDLAVTNLGLHRPDVLLVTYEDDQRANEKYKEVSQTVLFQVLVRLFRQSFVQAREKIQSGSGALDATYAYLAFARLIETDLANANMPMSNLQGASLQAANLRGANLRGANLRGADLTGANLRGADLTEANLRSANLRRADLRGANLRGADLWVSFLSGANLRGANLTRAVLWGANLSGADLAETEFIDADLARANLTDANLWMSVLSRADLNEVDFSRANLVEVDLTDANLRGADLTDANLTKAKVIQEQLNQAKSLEGAVRLDSLLY